MISQLVPLLSVGSADGVEEATAGRVVRWHFDSGYDIKNEVCVSDEFSFLHDPELVSVNNQSGHDDLRLLQVR